MATFQSATAELPLPSQQLLPSLPSQLQVTTLLWWLLMAAL